MEEKKHRNKNDRVLDVPKLPWGIRAVEKLLLSRCAVSTARIKTSYQVFIFFLTYTIYAFYTLARRPFTVIKIVLCPPCTNETLLNSLLEDSNNGMENASDVSIAGWPPFNSTTQGKTLLGSVDYSLIFAYATGLYISGYIADRVKLRYFLTVGIAGSGIAALLLGLGFFFQVYHLAYFIVFQILAGFMQSTGWPGLLGVTAKWFGRKK